jgi:hypothetical protein
VRILGIAACAVAAAVLVKPAMADPLPSWNDGSAKSTIVNFVEAVTTEEGSDYVAPAERIAAFDNDGTLWGEQPIYVQVAFVLDRVRELAPEHSKWEEQEPFKSALAGDVADVAASGEKGLLELLAATHAGMTGEEFETIVSDWIATARHPESGRPYTDHVFQLMIEVIGYLKDSGFNVFIVSGGGRSTASRRRTWSAPASRRSTRCATASRRSFAWPARPRPRRGSRAWLDHHQHEGRLENDLSD